MTTPATGFRPLPRKGWARLWPRRIGWRLAIGFGALVGLMLLALSQAGVQLHVVADVTERFASGDMPRLLRVQALSLQTEGVGSALVRLVNAPRRDRVAEYADVDARNRRLDGMIESLATELTDPEQQDTLKRLQLCRAQYAAAFIDTVDEVEADNPKAAARALNEKVNPTLKAMLIESNALLQRERNHVEAELASAQQQFRRAAAWVGALSLGVVVLAIGLAWRTTRSVVDPLNQLEVAAKRIAGGDYAQHVAPTGTQEVDRVGRALNTMVDAVGERQAQIERLAYHDPLTGLPNRTALLQPLSSITPSSYNSLVLMDLARLKAINETLGYPTGDTMIKETGKRVHAVFEAAAASGLIAPEFTVARLSGGIFAGGCRVDSRQAVVELRQRIEHSMAHTASCSGHSVDLSLAFGLADCGEQGDLKPIDALLRNAEVALHAAKRQALSHTWYNEAQEAARLGHLSLVSDLRAAVAHSHLQMWLQPKFALRDGSAVGAEALVRWQHPERGFISPAEFVPFAEQTGYITLVTDWMLSQALSTLQTWESRQPQLSIAVNVSTRDLQHGGFAQRVAERIAASGVNPQRLRLEITESGLMEDAQKSVALLHELRSIGVPLSIDDFGTGYSSLAYLQKLPVSELKIDRAFIDGIDRAEGSQKLVKAMIEMGHGMDLMVTAEGVETAAERATIAGLGCDVMQGYLASRPLHGPALQTWFEALPARA